VFHVGFAAVITEVVFAKYA